MKRAAPKVALLGAGRMGAIHGCNAARNPRLDLAYLIDPREDSAARLADELGCRRPTLAEALADPELVGVLIASPTDTHLEFVLTCLRAGKAVFCEKPLGLELSRLRGAEPELISPTTPLYVAFNRRFDPHFLALKAKLVSGEVGALETLNLISHDPAPPPPSFVPTSGGMFRDFTIHDFDVAAWLMEEEPAEVFAWASCLIDPAIGAAGDVDTARVVLRYPSGRMCTISNTRRSAYGYDQRAEAYGSRGMAMAGNPRISAVDTWSEYGALAAPLFGSFQERYAQSYRAELDHFADVLAGATKPITAYVASRDALILAEAVGQSVRTGRIVRVNDI